jgi:hypothetical protein
MSEPQKRIWTPADLAAYFGFSVHWVYKNTSPKADDPVPRCPGIGRLRFDTQSPSFLAWLERHTVDNSEDANV